MKRTASLLLILLMVLAVGCSKKKSTQPEPEPDYTLEASQTIGPEGDSLVISDFSLIVPPGAFASNATLKLYASSKDKPMGDRSATRTFKLEGLPDEYSQPLKLCMKYEGTISNQGYLAAGGMATHPGSDELKPTFSLFPAADSSGYLCGELPAMERKSFSFLGRSHKSRAGADGTSLMVFVGVQDYDPPKQTAHFKIYTQSDLSESWKFVLTEAVEPAYDSLKNLGLNLDLVPWPINVYTLYFLGDDTSRHCIFSPVYGTFNLIVDDKPMLMGEAEYLLIMKAAIIRELAHAILCTYDKEYFDVLLFHTVKINPRHYWLHHAVASWCEERFLKQRPLDFDYAQRGDSPFAPFRGMQAGAENDLKSSLKHGGGMYAVIEYLTVYYREDVIWRIYELGIKNGMHPVEAILNSVEEEANEWWPDFFKGYVNTEICDLDYGYFTSLDAVTDTCSINSKADTHFTFGGDYPDLSAKTYRFLINYDDIDTVRFTVESSEVEPEDIMIEVFSSNDTVLFDTTADNLIAQGNEQVAVDVNQLFKDGYHDLSVVVVNSAHQSPYTNLANIDLNAQVIFKSGLSQKRFGLGAELQGHWLRDDSTWYDNVVRPHWYCCMGYGQFSGYTFNSSWDTSFISEDEDRYSRGKITATVDPTLTKVTSYQLIDTTWFTDGRYDTIIVNISGSNLPRYGTSVEDMEFRVNGINMCNYITSFKYRDQEGSDWVEVKNYWCDGESYITLWFYKE